MTITEQEIQEYFEQSVYTKGVGEFNLNLIRDFVDYINSLN